MSIFSTGSEASSGAAPSCSSPASDPLDRVKVIVAGFSKDDRGALSGCFGNRVWGRENLPTDERGREIQDRLTRTGAFRG